MLFVFIYEDVQYDFHLRWRSCRLTVIRLVSLLKQELLSFPEFTSSFTFGPFSVGHYIFIIFYILFSNLNEYLRQHNSLTIILDVVPTQNDSLENVDIYLSSHKAFLTYIWHAQSQTIWNYITNNLTFSVVRKSKDINKILTLVSIIITLFRNCTF